MSVQYISVLGLEMFVSRNTIPHFFEEVVEYPPHVMMWAGVTSELITEPHSFDVSVTGESCLELLSHWLIPELYNIGLLNNVVL
jgi:branched-subunit amino acid transport protein